MLENYKDKKRLKELLIERYGHKTGKILYKRIVIHWETRKKYKIKEE